MSRYDGDKSFDEWVSEVGSNGHRLRRMLTDMAEQKVDWDGFVGSRTATEVAIALGRTMGSGTAQAGAATTVTLAAGDTQPDDYYNTATIRITGGTGKGQEKIIDDYVESTQVATVDSAWSTNPDATSTYAIQVDINLIEKAINNGNKIKRIAFGDVAQTPANDLFSNIRKFT